MKTSLPRILAIDDTPTNLMTLGTALEGEFELQFATSGSMGIQLALQSVPDLILLDVMMPEVDGFETFRRLAANATLKHIPVIFVTALHDFDSEVAGLSLGAADYITKPINVVIARQRVRNLLVREQLRKEVQVQAASLRILAVAVEQSPASVTITNLDACIEYVNPSFTEVTGYSADEVRGKNPRMLQSGLTPLSTHLAMWKALSRGQAWTGELINRRKCGAVYWEEVQIAPVKDEGGVVTHYVAVKTDISERKALEEQVHQLAFYDPLTGQPNRRLLGDRWRQSVAASKRSGLYGALMFLDLDAFKPLNDTHGHKFGDLLLVEAARRLVSCVRAVDTVARVGGDEFVLLLSELDVNLAASTAQALGVAEKVRASLAVPYFLRIQPSDDGASSPVEHVCTASIGVVVFSSEQANQDEVVKWADTAMYQAKDAGRNAVQLYEAAVPNAC